jgi:hypothetical protein
MKLDSYLAEKVRERELANEKERAACQSRVQPTPSPKRKGRPRADGERECARVMHIGIPKDVAAIHTDPATIVDFRSPEFPNVLPRQGLPWAAVTEKVNAVTGKSSSSLAIQALVRRRDIRRVSARNAKPRQRLTRTASGGCCLESGHGHGGTNWNG